LLLLQRNKYLKEFRFFECNCERCRYFTEGQPLHHNQAQLGNHEKFSAVEDELCAEVKKVQVNGESGKSKLGRKKKDPIQQEQDNEIDFISDPVRQLSSSSSNDSRFISDAMLEGLYCTNCGMI
jgi:hypothetical protein